MSKSFSRSSSVVEAAGPRRQSRQASSAGLPAAEMSETENPPVVEPPPEIEPIEEEEVLDPPCIDMSGYGLKVDHFDNMHVLSAEGAIPGVPNFRQVNGFPVWGMGQPTEEGIMKVLEKIPKGSEEKPLKTIWYNMRQEPIVYLNGSAYAPRNPDKLHENLLLNDPVNALNNLQLHLTNIVKARLADNPSETLDVHKDASYTENPMEREDVVETIKVDNFKGLHQIQDEVKESGVMPGLETVRIPFVEEPAPQESCFDLFVQSLKNEPAATQCIFSCQMGRGRTTMGLILCCLVKEIQISTELRRMGKIELVPMATVENLIKQKFEAPLPRTQDDDDPFIKGEFDVIKELLEKVPEAVYGKYKVDRAIDICGPEPKGTGLTNLRESIIETKWKYDVAPEEKQVAWKNMILDFMERYFYLICFSTYALEYGPDGYKKTFVQWMDDRKELRGMIEEGKDKLEWYRQVDPVKLNTLKDLISAPNYKENMPTLIRTIYEFAFLTYSDLPRGPIKNNSMRKLAAKTLMEILPTDIAENVQKKLDETSASPDFVTLVGLVSYYGEDGQVVIA